MNIWPIISPGKSLSTLVRVTSRAAAIEIRSAGTCVTRPSPIVSFVNTRLASRSHSEYAEGSDLVSMMKEDLFAERIAIESYSEIVRWLGTDDLTTRRMIEEILKVEEEHAEDLKSLLEKIS